MDEQRQQQPQLKMKLSQCWASTHDCSVKSWREGANDEHVPSRGRQVMTCCSSSLTIQMTTTAMCPCQWTCSLAFLSVSHTLLICILFANYGSRRRRTRIATWGIDWFPEICVPCLCVSVVLTSIASFILFKSTTNTFSAIPPLGDINVIFHLRVMLI